MKTIIWDVDDVLNDLTAEWFRRAWLPAHAASPNYDDLTENPPHRLLHVPLATYLESLDDFRRDCYGTLKPVGEVTDWFVKQGSLCRHVALSAVPRPWADLTAAWVIRHFGAWINTFAFVPLRGERAKATTMAASKREYLAWLGKGDVLVEDRSEARSAASELGLTCVLVPRPWNERRGSALESALLELSGVLEDGDRSSVRESEH